jgi:hypothetical protein
MVKHNPSIVIRDLAQIIHNRHLCGRGYSLLLLVYIRNSGRLCQLVMAAGRNYAHRRHVDPHFLGRAA